MVSLITDLKLSVCSAAISALATFAERDASASGASLTIVLALWRSLTNALWQFLLDTWWNSNRLEFHCVGRPRPKWRQKHNLLDPVAGPPVGNQRQTRGIPMSKATTSKSDATANNHRARNSATKCLSGVLCVFCVFVFCITAAHAQADVDEPFGLSTFPAEETAMAATWKALLVEINNDLSIVAKCREQSESCSSPAAIEFLSIAKEGERHDGPALIGHLNRAANFAIRPLDTAHVDDEWRSPLAILARSSGDCKHYAVLKYAMLRELGVSPDALKIIVVEVRSIHQLHAVLSVRAEKGRWLLLDNRTLMLIESSMALDYYDPLYELDQNGVRQFASSPRSPQLDGFASRSRSLR